MLQRDPAQRPTNEEILNRLGARAATAVVPDHVWLVGRRGHLEAMNAAFDAVRDGHPIAISLHGGSGEGKTFLVETFLERVATEKGAVVFAGRCYETEAVPYKALDSLIDALSRYLKSNRDLAEKIVPRDARALIRVFRVLQNVPSLVDAPQRAQDRGVLESRIDLAL